MDKITLDEALDIIDRWLSRITLLEEAGESHQSISTLKSVEISLCRLKRLLHIEYMNNPRLYTAEEVLDKMRKIVNVTLYPNFNQNPHKTL